MLKTTSETNSACISIDFETYYTGTYSVKELGNRLYCRDRKFQALLVASYDGRQSAVSTPDDYPWTTLHGKTLIAHNAAFDRAVWRRLQLDGVIPAEVVPAGWRCSANACSFCGIARDLKTAVKALYGVELDKSVRDRMEGAQGDFFDDPSKYAGTDAEYAFKIWTRLSPNIPESELRLMDLTDEMGDHGVCIDMPALEAMRTALAAEVKACVEAVPFCPIGSKKEFDAACRAIGLEPPLSVADDGDSNPEFLASLHPKIREWVEAVQRWRSCNRALRVLEAVADRVEDGRLRYQLKYFGAVPTGRWSGSGGLNMQNFNRSEVAGHSMRALICASPGHKLVIADYAQIEARVLLWLAGDRDYLEELRAEGSDIYEVAARRMLGYSDPEPLKKKDPALRQMAKAMTLGLGFGMGAKRFITAAKTLGGIDITFKDAQKAVKTYRDKNSCIVRYWQSLEDAFRMRADRKKPFLTLTLPSGRPMHYYGPSIDEGGEMTASQVLGEPPVKLHPGLLCENLVQATARDLLADAWLRLVTAGYRPVMSVHDELVFEAEEAGVNGTVNAVTSIKSIMSEPPAWAKSLPLAVDVKTSERYEK